MTTMVATAVAWTCSAAGDSDGLYNADFQTQKMVSMWYSPSESDVESTMKVLTKNQDAVTSVMLYCGYSIANDGTIQGTASDLCVGENGIVQQLRRLGIGVEFVLSDGCTNVTAHKIFMADPGSIPYLVALAKNYFLFGWNLDLEPQKVPGTAEDAAIYAAFCSKLRKALNDAGVRLTIDVAQWSPMLSQYAVLAPSVDRLLNMETYNANSLNGWLNGDAYGGYYEEYKNATLLRSMGVGLGTWPTAKCGNTSCWTTANASVEPRMAVMQRDHVPEVALFRLYGDHSAATPPNERWPQEFWWQHLRSFLKS